MVVTGRNDSTTPSVLPCAGCYIVREQNHITLVPSTSLGRLANINTAKFTVILAARYEPSVNHHQNMHANFINLFIKSIMHLCLCSNCQSIQEYLTFFFNLFFALMTNIYCMFSILSHFTSAFNTSYLSGAELLKLA